MVFFWSRSSPALTHEYQESVAHRVRDILTGDDHVSSCSPLQDKRNKVAIKALQKPEALAGVINILKSMPEPSPRDDGWEVDEGVELDSDDEDENENDTHSNSKENHNENNGASLSDIGAPLAAVVTSSTASAGASAGASTGVSGGMQAQSSESQVTQPEATTIIAAATIVAAAATSAAAATLAVRGRKKRLAQQMETKVVVGEDGSTTTTTTTTTNTIVRFHPSPTTVSSCAYWWGYEIFIPQEALSRIASAQDVSTAFLSFLGSVGLMVPAIIPFLGYIAAYVGLEFAVIKAQNEGKGVILASTWLVPVALVPRAWDVPDEAGVDGNNGSA
ncbi:hypothetical protein BG011_000007 [Mortierella polycephala]|uniref:Uncharacterized protein n=1 Tax=Mortierella polycephala TaxID=41804 RepID=A0A9P6QIZ8_9FUNG|nr:hypothetical protein BG011_000007 [Mortierella polycephala]